MLSPPAWTRSSPRSKRNGYTGTGYMPAPVFSCPHAEHQFDIREPVVVCVHLVYLIRWRHSAPILRVILFHGGEGRELTESPTLDKTIRERPNRADKNAPHRPAPRLAIRPALHPALHPAHGTPRRTTRHHRTANRHAATPRTPTRTPPRHTTPPHRHAAMTLRRHTQTATNTPPSDTPDGTNTKRATAATE